MPEAFTIRRNSIILVNNEPEVYKDDKLERIYIIQIYTDSGFFIGVLLPDASIESSSCPKTFLPRSTFLFLKSIGPTGEDS
jgi:hypothetical protein